MLKSDAAMLLCFALCSRCKLVSVLGYLLFSIMHVDMGCYANYVGSSMMPRIKSSCRL